MKIENTALTIDSSNPKTGKMAVSTTARSSCAPDCPMAAACYAEAGYYTRTHWNKVSSGERGLSFADFIAALEKLKPAKSFRHNVAGDLWHSFGDIDQPKLWRLADVVSRLRAAWTYTHHKMSARNLLAVRGAIVKGFTVNISCEDTTVAADYVKRGLPAVVVVPEDYKGTTVVDGVRIVQCPATRDGSAVQCVNCGGANGKPLCAIADRGFVIAFPAHGGKASLAPV